MKKFWKRALDILISSLAVIILLPILVAIALVIKLSSKGPVLFKQQRVGKASKPFVLYKFRTMKIDVDPYGQSPKFGNDPRLIKAGRFLREYSLDELPQLFNVLKAEMSIVGPRPLYESQILELNEHHKKRLMVKPGITGLSQIYRRSELTSMASLDMAVEYVEQQSLCLDLKIIFLTFWAVMSKKGVYEK